MDAKKLGKRGNKMELAMNSKFMEMNEHEMMEVDGGSFLAAAFVLGLKTIKITKVVAPALGRAVRNGAAGAASYVTGSRVAGHRPTVRGALGAAAGAVVGFGIMGGR